METGKQGNHNGKVFTDAALYCHSAKEYLEFAKVRRLKKDPVAAKPYLQQMRPSYLTVSLKEKPLTFFSPLRKFRALGPGVYFLFYTLRYFTIVFFILSMVSLMEIFNNLKGEGLLTDPGTPFWVKTTIANSARYDFTLAEINVVNGDNDEMIMDVLSSKSKIMQNLMQSTLLWNSTFVILFIIAIYAFKYLVLEERLRVEHSLLSIARFSLKIKGFPGRTTTKKDIEDFVGRFYDGKIIDIHFTYKFKDSLQDLKRLGKKTIELEELKSSKAIEDGCAKKVSKLEKSVDKLTKSLMRRFKVSQFDSATMESSLEKLEAYVVLNDSSAPSKVCKEVARGSKRPGCFAKRPANPQFEILGRPVQATLVDDANDINFEHIEKSNFWKFINIVFVILLCLVIIGCFLMLSMYVDHLFDATRKSYACEIDLDAYDTISNLATDSADYPERYSCFCKYTYKLLVNDVQKAFCAEYLYNQRSFYYLALVIVIIIEFANILTSIVIEKLVSRLHFELKSNKLVTKVVLLFTMAYLNTLVNLMISGELLFGKESTASAGEHSASGHGRLSMHGGLLREINNRWFLDFGYKVILLIFFLVLFPHAFFAIIQKVIQWIKNRRAQRSSLQYQYIKLKAPFKFALTEHYVVILNLIFCTLTFAAGMPLLVVLCFLAFLCIYGCLKFVFVYNSRRPRFLKPVVVQVVVKLLPFAVIMHLAFAIVIYGNQFIEITYETLTQYKSGQSVREETFLNSAVNIIFVKCFPLTVILIIYIAAIVAECILYKCFKGSLKKYLFKSKVANITYEENCIGLGYWSALNYDFRRQPKYLALFALENESKAIPRLEELERKRSLYMAEKGGILRRPDQFYYLPQHSKETQKMVTFDDKHMIFEGEDDISIQTGKEEAPIIARDVDVSQFEQSLSPDLKQEVRSRTFQYL